ncbi:hypothetical protein ILYODFUR_019811 [Ilyodon furcidens]|uniref:Secreted protein n=1 Tax=Ilyodon furcidens TaxID=33524 RepID=A0ABV0TK84_9TELE
MPKPTGPAERGVVTGRCAVVCVCVCVFTAEPVRLTEQENGGGLQGIIPWTICLAGCAHNKEGPRMVLVHVGYLVLPVFGSVRNRGMTRFTLFFFMFYSNPRYIFSAFSSR